MKLSITNSGPWQHTLDIEVPAEDVESRLEHAARALRPRVQLPGFRKGKVPLEMVRQNFPELVEREFLEPFLNETTASAMREARLDPAVPALIRDLRFVPGQPMSFKAVVEVTPRVEVKDHRGIPLMRRVRRVEDAAVERQLEELRDQSAVFLDVDRPAGRGDVVLADSVRLDANGRRLPTTRGRGLRLELGHPEMLRDLEAGLLGAEAGQTRTIAVQYPAEHPSAELAGKSLRYEVRVRKIQEKKLRDLDDNFARDLFGLESVAVLRDRVRANLERDEELRVRRELESAVTDELVRRDPFDLPDRLVHHHLERYIHEAAGGREVPEELHRELETRYRPAVERALKRDVLLEAVARQEGLTVTDEEIAAEIERMAQADPRQAARIRARYQSDERRRLLGQTVLEGKAMDWLIEHANVREEVLRDEPLIVPAAR
ncbi:MAG: trigger factor [Candidatus Eisenbacteria bacterium]